MIGEILELGVTKLLEHFPAEKFNFEKRIDLHSVYFFYLSLSFAVVLLPFLSPLISREIFLIRLCNSCF